MSHILPFFSKHKIINFHMISLLDKYYAEKETEFKANDLYRQSFKTKVRQLIIKTDISNSARKPFLNIILIH